MYHARFESYAPDKGKIKFLTKGNNSVNIAARVMVLEHCTASCDGLDVYEVR